MKKKQVLAKITYPVVEQVRSRGISNASSLVASISWSLVLSTILVSQLADVTFAIVATALVNGVILLKISASPVLLTNDVVPAVKPI